MMQRTAFTDELERLGFSYTINYLPDQELESIEHISAEYNANGVKVSMDGPLPYHQCDHMGICEIMCDIVWHSLAQFFALGRA